MSTAPEVGDAGDRDLDPARVVRVSVIIPVYDQWDHLRACLEALAQQSLGADSFEVLVVDNGSRTTPPFRDVAGLSVRWVEEPLPGSYAARNAGVRAARAELLAFTDADCRPVVRWLEEGLRVLDGPPRVDLVGGAIELFAVSADQLTAVEAYELVKAFPQQRYVEVQGFAATANLMLRRSVLELVGPFEERLRSGGDREFGQRAGRAGCTWAYAPLAVVRHPARRTFHELHTKLRRVVSGSRDSRVIDGLPLLTRDEVLHGLLPPLGAVRRALRDPRLPKTRAKCGYVLAEFYVRYVGTYARVVSALREGSPRS